ncbi:MAG: glycosyltransferase family 2 protein [Hyphomicrobium sp.]
MPDPSPAIAAAFNASETSPINEVPNVLIAIVNYCTADLTIDCLRSLEPEIIQNPHTIAVVADNASPDGSLGVIANAIETQGWSAWARTIAMPRNGGFAYATNAIIRNHSTCAAFPSYVWLLNSDTVVRPGALRTMLQFLNANPEVGIAGSCLEDPDGTQQCSAFRFHTLASEFEGSVSLTVVNRLLQKWAVAPQPTHMTAPYDWVSGASLLFRGELISTVGLLDERFFLYYEETDFCRRARAAGWTCWFVTDSRVVHLVGKSSGMTDRDRRTLRRSDYWFRSRQLYFVKNHGRLYAIVADVALALGTLINRAHSKLRQRPAQIPDYFISDLARNSAILGALGGVRKK